MMKEFVCRAAVPLGLLAALATGAPAQQSDTEYDGAAALGLELRRLGTIKRVLMVGAHPDDENTQILSALALGQGAEVAYLSLTRGEGGQNGIGPELEEGLGLLRTEELLAARRLDGARQFFTRAYDFGFSRHAEEAFRHWPREALLADVVAVVRSYRPDVVVSVFSGTPRDGHGQHQAAGILAREAFEAAGDPARFPQQIAAGLRPFAPAKLYLALWGAGGEADAELQTGDRDALLGQSHFQVAMASRSRHRSQDMGRPLTPGPQSSALELAATRSGGDGAGASLFAGVDTTLSALAFTLGGDEGSALASAAALLGEYEARVERARGGFNPLAAGELVGPLAGTLRLLRDAWSQLPEGELRNEVRREELQASAALWHAAGLELDAVADDETVVPGQSFELRLTLWNGGPEAVRVERLEPRLPEGWTATAAEPLAPEVAPGALAERRFVVQVPPGAEPTRPYFLARERQGDLYSWGPERQVGLPFDSAAIVASAGVVVAGVAVERSVEATFAALDRRQGEFRRPVRVVPAISLHLSPASAVVPLRPDGAAPEPLTLSARVRSEAPGLLTGRLELSSPPGWRVEPASLPLRFEGAGEERTIAIAVHPPSVLARGSLPVAAAFTADTGERYAEGASLVDYPHIRPHPVYRPARVAVHAFPVAVPSGLSIGYVPGAGDDAPEALRQMGIGVAILEGAALASGDLDQFDAILTGIRAYEVNPELLAHNERLLDYARRGGTVVVQYSKYEYTEPGIAPYPVSMSRPHGRVTDETAQVRILDPSHAALSWPNRITAADFEGWKQERGLYFLSEWDAAFTPLLEMADPAEEPLRGSLLVAPLGEGTYVYTGLAFFRQLPEGVSGAHRLLVNLLSLGKTP